MGQSKRAQLPPPLAAELGRANMMEAQQRAVNEQKKMIAEQQQRQEAMFVRHFVSETARDVYVRMIKESGKWEHDHDYLINLGRKAKEIAVDLAIGMGFLEAMAPTEPEPEPTEGEPEKSDSPLILP